MEEKVNESMAENKPLEVKEINNNAEYTLNVIANIVLICGIISTVICLFTIVFKEESHYYFTERVFSPSGFATTIMVLFSSLISWGFLKVLANISLTLKELNSKIK